VKVVAAKGGGAWKVAYADFVTAMMAFFLVMWICGQDQSVRKAVSFYFNDPFHTSRIGASKQPTRSGSFSEQNRFGSVPMADSAALGQGRKSYTPPEGKATATQLVSAWLHAEPKRMQYWQDQAQQAWAWAKNAEEVKRKKITQGELAAGLLAKSLKHEVSQEMAIDVNAVQQDLLIEALDQVNWLEIGEDLLLR
jgi:flagellar motor protein MotB